VKKNEGWEISLLTYLAEHESARFRWGSSDCMLFVADCVEAMTGEDVAKDLRGKYKSAKSAKKLLFALYGVTAYVEAVSLIFQAAGMQERLENYSVCVIDVDGEQIGGLYFNGEVIAFQKGGFVKFGKKRILKAWAV